jgi:hypothetical protein
MQASKELHCEKKRKPKKLNTNCINYILSFGDLFNTKVHFFVVAQFRLNDREGERGR